jgi:electron transfer flavoprotein beta subunit
MGPARAADILREALYRGADKGVLLTDRAFAGADTLATSYALSTAVKKIGKYDVVLCGRQAIDGDTAQVGPQVAQMLGLPQVTCLRRVISLEDGIVVAERGLDNGVEIVKAPLPLLLTVEGSAVPCRPRNAYHMLRFHRAATPSEQAAGEYRYSSQAKADEALCLKEWNLEYIGGDASRCGLSGSPTKVKKVENIVFKVKESKKYSASDCDLKAFVSELVENHIIG